MLTIFWAVVLWLTIASSTGFTLRAMAWATICLLALRFAAWPLIVRLDRWEHANR